MRHVVYTRCTYNTREEVARRLILSKRYTIPAMAAQVGCLPACWVWLCKPFHEDMIREAVRQAGYAGELVFNFRGKQEDIQSTLDSDDWIAPNFLADIQSRYLPSRLHIRYYHPWRLEHSTGKWYRPKKIANWTSMFYSVFNPTDAVRVYFRRHTQIASNNTGLIVQPVKQQGLCALVVHDSNIHTTIRRGDIEIPPPATFIDNRPTR